MRLMVDIRPAQREWLEKKAWDSRPRSTTREYASFLLEEKIVEEMARMDADQQPKSAVA